MMRERNPMHTVIIKSEMRNSDMLELDEVRKPHTVIGSRKWLECATKNFPQATETHQLCHKHSQFGLSTESHDYVECSPYQQHQHNSDNAPEGEATGGIVSQQYVKSICHATLAIEHTDRASRVETVCPCELNSESAKSNKFDDENEKVYQSQQHIVQASGPPLTAFHHDSHIDLQSCIIHEHTPYPMNPISSC